jgi:uncharacterized protein YggE
MHKRMMATTVLLGMTAAVCAQESTPPPVQVIPLPGITVRVTGVEQVAPDSLIVGVWVGGADKEVAKAREERVKRVEAIGRIVKELGLNGGAIRTGPFYINKGAAHSVYAAASGSLFGDASEKYYVGQDYELVLRDLTKVEQATEMLAKEGWNEPSMTYRIDDLAKRKEEVRGKALRTAREKAEGVAAAAGVHAGKVLGIEEVATQWTGEQFEERWGYFGPANVEPEEGQTREAGKLTVSAAFVVRYEVK